MPVGPASRRVHVQPDGQSNFDVHDGKHNPLGWHANCCGQLPASAMQGAVHVPPRHVPQAQSVS
jgi:hypothetical protein